MARFRNPALAQLSRQQVQYAPRSVRLSQIERAERFVDRLHPERSYAYGDVCEEVTGYRSEQYPDLRLTGCEAIRDLRCLVEDLSDSLDLAPADVGEPVLSVGEVASRYGVSPTVHRLGRGSQADRVPAVGRRPICSATCCGDRPRDPVFEGGRA